MRSPMLTRLFVRGGLAALCALSLSGCIDSGSPILANAEPVFGHQLRLQFYSLRNGVVDDPEQASYRWNGTSYAHAGGGMSDIAALTVHPFEKGEFIVQSVPAKKNGGIEYAVMRPLAEGVFMVVPVDEDDAEPPLRAANCKPAGHSCRIETRDQLFAFAKATAARRKSNGGLVLRLPDGPAR